MTAFDKGRHCLIPLLLLAGSLYFSPLEVGAAICLSGHGLQQNYKQTPAAPVVSPGQTSGPPVVNNYNITFGLPAVGGPLGWIVAIASLVLVLYKLLGG